METKKTIELIQKVIEGDERAFEELYEQYAKLVYYIAYKQCLCDADAKDIVQETFIEVQRTIHTLQNPSVFKFWLNRITLSKCKNLFRKNKYVNIDGDSSMLESLNVEERRYMVPQKNARYDSDQAVLNEMINELPLGQRQVYVLYYLEQFHIDEIAQLLDIPQGTVKSRLSYARESLKKKIELYERTEHTKLNFYSLASAIPAAMAMELASITLPAPKAHLMYKAKPSSIVSTFAGKALFVVGIVSVASAGAYAFQRHQSQAIDLPQADKFEQVENTSNFPELIFKGKQIKTAESAYFNLKYWLCCEDELQELNKDDFEEIKPIYEALRKQNTTYYALLKESGWSTSFETLYEKFTSY